MRSVPRVLRLLASFAALTTAVVVLVGDSTNDCEIYNAWAGELRFQTSCGPGAEGLVSIEIPQAELQPTGHDVKIEVLEGTASISAFQVDYGGSCSGGEGQGNARSLVLDVVPDPSTSKVSYRCTLPLSAGALTGTCTAGDADASGEDAGAPCDLTLQPKSSP